MGGMEEQKKRYEGCIKRLCLMDDTFFNVCMDGYLAGVACILRIILALPELIVESVTVQKMTDSLCGRGVRFDAFARAGTRLMNIEVQRDDRGAASERARFNSSMMDARELQKGEEVTELPETYVIFIAEKDVLGKGLSRYHIERTIKETGEPFGDRSHIIYVNGTIQDETPLGRLMHDFFCQDAEKMYYEELRNRARFFKNEEGGRAEMCKIMDEIRQEGIDWGMERGMERDRLESLRTIMQTMRLSEDEAMNALLIPLEKREKYKALLAQ